MFSEYLTGPQKRFPTAVCCDLYLNEGVSCYHHYERLVFVNLHPAIDVADHILSHYLFLRHRCNRMSTLTGIALLTLSHVFGPNFRPVLVL